VAVEILELKQRLIAGMVSYMEFERTGGGDPCYSQADIDRCDQIIDGFLTRLASAPEGDKNEFILETVKATVFSLNQLNKDCNLTIIETDQREDLCALIILAAKNAGLASINGDITYQWREW
jgi:hypothetical protein